LLLGGSALMVGTGGVGAAVTKPVALATAVPMNLRREGLDMGSFLSDKENLPRVSLHADAAKLGYPTCRRKRWRQNAVTCQRMSTCELRFCTAPNVALGSDPSTRPITQEICRIN
jgi:hypothetical protein